LWLDCFTEVRRRIQAVYGFTNEIPLPSVSAHLWDADLKKYGPGWAKDLAEAMPTYRDLGFKHVFTHGVWNSITNDPTKSEADGNICCPYDYHYAEEFGGAKNMKWLFDEAHKAGLKMFQWFGMQHSKYSKVWKEHPEWILREANGDPWDGNYGILCGGRMRSGFIDKIKQEILDVKKDTGLDAIFWDSYQNIGITCVDWQAPDKAPQADEIWKMQTEFQKAGFMQRCEVTTIFGVSQVALYGFAGDKFRRRLWQHTVDNDDAFALMDCSPGYFSDGPVFTADRLNPQSYFWLAGHRVLPIMSARPWGKPEDPTHGLPHIPSETLAPQYARVNHLYNKPPQQNLWVNSGSGRFPIT